MNAEEKILHKARSHFDVAGATILPDGSSLLILGLESTHERNLDEFGRKAGKFMLYGFKKHADSKLQAVVNYLHKKGFSARPAGRLGYPLEGEINLKTEAIKAGLGKRGKSTVVLHPEYGPRLRFMALVTSAHLCTASPDTTHPETDNPTCRECNICIEVCPVQVLDPYVLTRPSVCLSNISPQSRDGRSILCDKCLAFCPAGKTIG